MRGALVVLACLVVTVAFSEEVSDETNAHDDKPIVIHDDKHDHDMHQPSVSNAHNEGKTKGKLGMKNGFVPPHVKACVGLKEGAACSFVGKHKEQINSV